MTSEVRYEALRSGVETNSATVSAPRVFTEHYHCPCGCDHPQPFALADGRQYCGACYHYNSTFCMMVLCTPETCVD